jgi:hypothetical protein
MVLYKKTSTKAKMTNAFAPIRIPKGYLALEIGRSEKGGKSM